LDLKYVADRLEHFFLGFEVVVERARGERRGADDVAHCRRAESQLGENLLRRLQNETTVLRLCLFALAQRRPRRRRSLK
jgi:hypothetical protein